MSDLTARAAVVKSVLDRDVELLKVFGRVLQHLHAIPHLDMTLEVDILSQMIDSYESLGRFIEADMLRQSRRVLSDEIRRDQVRRNEALMDRSELASFARTLEGSL